MRIHDGTKIKSISGPPDIDGNPLYLTIEQPAGMEYEHCWMKSITVEMIAGEMANVPVAVCEKHDGTIRVVMLLHMYEFDLLPEATS